MQRTDIINDGPEVNWQKTLTGKIQLRCPICDEFFTLGKDFKIDDNGNVLSVVYHHCDDDEEHEAKGWTVLPRLVGWKA